MKSDELKLLLNNLKKTIFKDMAKNSRTKSSKVFITKINKDYDSFLEVMANEIGSSKTQIINDALTLFIESYDKLNNDTIW